MVRFCNCNGAVFMAAHLYTGCGGKFYAPIAGAGGKSLYRRVSDADGTFFCDFGRSADWFNIRDFPRICDGGIDGSV